MPLVRRFI